MTETSVKTYCRAVGILLILTIAGGWFGEMYVPSVMLAGDAAATAGQLRLHDSLFRLGFAAYLVEAFSDILLAWLFYVLLRPVHRDLALLSALIGIVSMTIFAVTKMFYFSAPALLRGDKYLAAFNPDQVDALASSYVLLYAALSGLSFLFYGAAWLVRGYLTFRSGYLPRWLGALMILAGFGFVAKTLTYILGPAYSSDLLMAPMFLNSVALMLWMLFKGIDPGRWPAAAGTGNPAAT